MVASFAHSIDAASHQNIDLAPFDFQLLGQKLDTHKRHGQTVYTVHANVSFVNPWPVSISRLNGTLSMAIYYNQHHILGVTLPKLELLGKRLNAPIPVYIETNPDAMDALDEFIERYSDGKQVSLTIKHLNWQTDAPGLIWLRRIFCGLAFEIPLPKIQGASQALDAIRLFLSLEKLMMSLE